MGKKGGGGRTSTVTKADPWAGVQPYIKDYLQKAQEQFQTPYQEYEGQRIAGLNQDQQQAMDLMRGRVSDPLVGGTKSLLGETVSGQYLDSNPYLDAQFENMSKRISDAYRTGTAAQTSALGRASGSFGNTGVQQLREQQNRAFGDTLSNLASSIYGQNYQQERGRQLQAAAMLPMVAGQERADIQGLMGVGDINRQYNQQQLNQQYADWVNRVNYPQTQLDRYRGAVATGMGAGGTSTSTGPNPYQQNIGANVLGGGLAGASLVGALGSSAPAWMTSGVGAGAGALLGLLSDRRAKTDIKKVGKTDDGLNVYTYRYKFGGPVHMGVMAQEVEKKIPDAVEEIDGVKTVKYGLIGD